MKDIMVDIETLATHNNAVITQIGACYFNRDTGEIENGLLVNIDIQSCLDIGLTVDGGAIKFWLNQLGRSFLENTVSLEVALKQLNGFCKSKKHYLWAHANFDFPILNNAYIKTKIKPTFSYKNLRDIRTLIDLSKFKEKREPGLVTHNALEDCIRQVNYCTKGFKKLKENPS